MMQLFNKLNKDLPQSGVRLGKPDRVIRSGAVELGCVSLCERLFRDECYIIARVNNH